VSLDGSTLENLYSAAHDLIDADEAYDDAVDAWLAAASASDNLGKPIPKEVRNDLELAAAIKTACVESLRDILDRPRTRHAL
jgi:hypothetical protein